MPRFSWLNRPTQWLARHRERVILGFGLVAFESVVALYDKVFFPFAIFWWGPLWGAIIPSVIALMLNALLYAGYDRWGIDWLKARTLRELADSDTKTRLQKLMTWHRQPKHTLRDRLMGELAFALLTVTVDPVILATYYRESYFEGVSRRDWLLLVKATAVGCVVWTLIFEPIVFAIKYFL